MGIRLARAEGRVKRAFVAGAEWRATQGPTLTQFQAVDAAEDLYPYGLE